jgi:hypothetical protein
MSKDYLIVDHQPGEGLTSQIVPNKDLAAWCKARGIEITGRAGSPAELEGYPIIAGLFGPTRHGDWARYETWAAVEVLSG